MANKTFYKLKNTYLEFDPHDISYIIVKKESEIPEIIKFILNKYADKCTAGQRDILITKITSIENIENDFQK